jgi:intracellular septation protein A
MALAEAAAFARRNFRTALVEVLVNLILPYAIYSYAEKPAGDVKALLLSMIPPLGWSIVEFARKRRVDIFSLFIIAGIVLSLLAFIGGGSVKFLQLREALVTGVFGLAFLVSAAIRRPLIYELARASSRRKSAADAEAFERLNAGNVHVRRSMIVMTVVWGAGLIAQTALACVLVFAVPITTYLLISPVLGWGTIGALALWTVLYVRERKRIGAARAAREAAASTPS